MKKIAMALLSILFIMSCENPVNSIGFEDYTGNWTRILSESYSTKDIVRFEMTDTTYTLSTEAILKKDNKAIEGTVVIFEKGTIKRIDNTTLELTKTHEDEDGKIVYIPENYQPKRTVTYAIVDNTMQITDENNTYSNGNFTR